MPRLGPADRGKNDLDIGTTVEKGDAEVPFSWKRRYDTTDSKDDYLATALAQEAKPKLRRRQASILNSEGMFGSKPIGAAEHDASVRPRKRRLSESALRLGSTTPMKGVTAGASPKTMPMPQANKRSKTENANSLSSSVIGACSVRP